MHRRILILGTTGTAKKVPIEKCSERLKNLFGHSARIVDFDKECLHGAKNFRTLQSYLAKPQLEQRSIWAEGWQDFKESLNKDLTILLMHGTIVRDDFGARIAMDTVAVARDFKPTLVITLIDDIFNCWGRTEQRSRGELGRGRPTFEQLLMARRTEAMLGDEIICRQEKTKTPSKHVMLAVQHPVSALCNLILAEAKIVYLSFPISAPIALADSKAKQKKQKGLEVKKAINDFHRRALEIQESNQKIVFISPLSIDELPFVKITANNSKCELFDFDIRPYRWSINDLWPDTTLLSDPGPKIIKSIPIELAMNVGGLLKTDIGWRDYRLVEQADYLACYSPVVPRKDNSWKVSRGVKAELEKAKACVITAYVYQEPDFDQTKQWEKFVGPPGSMGYDDWHRTVANKNSMNEVFEALKANLS